MVKDRLAMERSRSIDAVIFDKTGTLTHGKLRVKAVHASEGIDEATVLQLAAAVEGSSEHPVASTVVSAAKDRGLAIPASSEFEAVRRLRERGIEVLMITGDSESVASEVAEELEFDRYFAEVLPADKAAYVEDLKSEGLRVSMVGDGVNDAPVLEAADVGVAIGAGTDVGMETMDVILVRDDPRDVVRMIDLSLATQKEDDPEPGVGFWIQCGRDSPGGGCVGVGWLHPTDGGGCRDNVRQHGNCGAERSVTEDVLPSGPRPGSGVHLDR